MKRVAVLVMMAALLGISAPQVTGQESGYTPKRINKAIELLETGQPVYYVQVNGGGYEAGLRLAKSHADVVGYNLEQAPFNVTELKAFIQGLIDGGPTLSGHRTPAVVVTLPVPGLDGPTMRANTWMVEQVLAAGAHGVWLVHTRSADAVREFVRAARYPFAPPLPGIEEGLRGSGGQGLAAAMWGISAAEYLQKADLWPDNPAGEIFLGLKVEDKHGLEIVDELVSVPGIAMAEWGPGDMTMSLELPREAPAVQAARARVLESLRRHGRVLIDVSSTVANVRERIDEEGILFHFADEETARFGRAHTGRTMPY